MNEWMLNNHFIFHLHINFRIIFVLLLMGRIIWLWIFVFWFFWFTAFAFSFPHPTSIFKYILIVKSIILVQKCFLNFMSDWVNPQFFFKLCSQKTAVVLLFPPQYPAQTPVFTRSQIYLFPLRVVMMGKLKTTQFHLHKIYEDELEW